MFVCGVAELAKSMPKNVLTVSGRMMTIALAASLFAIVDSSLAPLISNLFWLLLTAFCIGLLFRPQLKFHLATDVLVANGEHGSIRIAIQNTGGSPAYDLEFFADAVGMGYALGNCQHSVSLIPTGGKVVLEYPFLANQRGEHPLPRIRFTSCYPFGLFRFGGRYELIGQVLVAPSTRSLDIEANATSVEHSMDKALATITPRTSEYLGSREYQTGMMVRRWDFAAWARHGSPAIREYGDAGESIVAIFVDAYSTTGSNVDADLETLLSKVASSVVSLWRGGHHLLLIIAEDSLRIVDSRSVLDAQAEMLKQLARVKGSARSDRTWREGLQYLSGLQPEASDLVMCFARRDHSAILTDIGQLERSSNWMLDWTPSSSSQ